MGTLSTLRTDEVPVSRSTRIVGAERARPRAKFTANVVLPTPPLPEATGIMRRIGGQLTPSAGPARPLRPSRQCACAHLRRVQQANRHEDADRMKAAPEAASPLVLLLAA